MTMPQSGGGGGGEDKHVDVVADTTSKAYVLGTTSTPAATATNTTAVADTGVYLGTTPGELVATKFTGDLDGNAASASKVGSATVGSSEQPVYFENGVPVQSQYKMNTLYNYMTQAEYEALENPDPDTLYWVVYQNTKGHVIYRGTTAVDVCTEALRSNPTQKNLTVDRIMVYGISLIGNTNYSYFPNIERVDLVNITSVGNYAFYNCANLNNVAVPEGTISIDTYGFRDCVRLTQVSLPNTLTNIGHSAFCGCITLPTVTIPANVTQLQDYAFYYCLALTDFNFAGTMSQWNDVTLGVSWKDSSPFTVVHCSDGDSSRLS
jgi:hypothetical protein